MEPTLDDHLTLSARLRDATDALSFSTPVTHVYNPLRYAWALHAAYWQALGPATGRVVLLGMNPGPWGMAQTGVPFGEIAAVRDWMGLQGAVGVPDSPHPKRPVMGLRCARSEVSGRRLWGWAAHRFGTAEAFFSKFVVLNYCPLSFMEATGRNRTPDKLPKAERQPLFEVCDASLRERLTLLAPTRVIGVGAFAEKRAKRVVPAGVPVGRVLHPSPASPKANRGWVAAAEADLRGQGLTLD